MAKTDSGSYNRVLKAIDDYNFYDRKEFNLSNTVLTFIPYPVAKLRSLESLKMTNGHIEDIKYINESSCLINLDLSNNKISNIESVGKLKKIKILNLSANKITDISNLDGLIDLEELMLEQNSIENIESISKLINLKRLVLDGNKISNVNALSKLIKLEELSLSNNRIKNIDELYKLKNLRMLNIEDNNITHFPLSLTKLNLTIVFKNSIISNKNFLFVNNNPWISPPIEIIIQGNNNINSYYKSFNNNNTKPLNEVKVIFVGEGAAGKTSLIKRLTKNTFNNNESQTHGIQISNVNLKYDKEVVRVNIWDFGGQEIMHSTHQFFLTERSVYILVIDSRNDVKLEYWLKHIEAFGKNANTLIVINKIDDNPAFDVNRPLINEKYSFVSNRFFKVSCKSGDGIDALKANLIEVIGNMEIRKQNFSNKWFRMKEKLFKMKQNYISYEIYKKYCLEFGIDQEDQQQTLLGFLNDLGIVFRHVQSEWHDTYVMNPQWLTWAVYKIINSPIIADNKGYLHKNQLKNILYTIQSEHHSSNKHMTTIQQQYPANKLGFILDMLKQFELCYEVKNNDLLMIPDLLPVSRKEIPINFEGAAQYLFVYDFLPNSVFPTIMIHLNYWILSDMQWRTGVVLKDESSESYARIETDKEEKTILVRVKSYQLGFQRIFLNLIRNTIQSINAKYNIKVEEKIALTDLENEYVSYQDLMNLISMDEQYVIIPRLKKRYLISELLGGIDSDISNTADVKFKRKRNLETVNDGKKDINSKVKIFISYSRLDLHYKENLNTFLNPLVRQEDILIWDDGQIQPGIKWKEEIMLQLEQSNILIALVSPDFIESDFCYSIELASSMKAHERGEKTIIPIQIRPSGWQDLPIGSIQSIPTKCISQYSDEDNGWLETYNKLKNVIEVWKRRLGE